jgi:hypothetical protein
MVFRVELGGVMQVGGFGLGGRIADECDSSLPVGYGTDERGTPSEGLRQRPYANTKLSR